MNQNQMEQLSARVEKLEKRDMEDLLTLLELMSNVYFFGGMKKANCEFAENGQCSLFYLENGAKSKVPVATECRITECKTHNHCHLEISNVTCTFCPQWNSGHDLAQIKGQAHGETKDTEADNTKSINEKSV